MSCLTLRSASGCTDGPAPAGTGPRASDCAGSTGEAPAQREVRATLTRVAVSKLCSLSKLETEGFSCVTMEPPWRDNVANESCIPRGEYLCVWHKSPRYGWVYAVTGVPDRTHILIHPGNIAQHTLGCILPGRRFGELSGQPAVLVSRGATRDLVGHFDRQPFTLEVTRA